MAYLPAILFILEVMNLSSRALMMPQQESNNPFSWISEGDNELSRVNRMK